MSTAPEEPSNLSFPSLYAVLARVAPDRLPELLADRDAQFARAAETGSYEPLREFQLKWAIVIELARRHDLAQRMEAAQRVVHTRDRDTPEWRAAMDEVREVYNEAWRAASVRR